jgi:hypothetical protein
MLSFSRAIMRSVVTGCQGESIICASIFFGQIMKFL